jgi:predicted RNA-binding protein (virulence factor B family)
MIRIGNINRVKINRKTDISYIAFTDENEEIFIHFREANQELEPNQEVDIFVYYDKQRRLCGTTNIPTITTTDIDFAEVVQISDFGVFVNIGIVKDFLVSKDSLPRERELWPEIGDKLCVNLAVKGNKLIAKPISYEEIKEIDNPEVVYNENEIVKAYVHRIGTQGTTLLTESKKDIFVYYKNQRKKERVGKLVEVEIISKTTKGNYNATMVKRKELMIDEDREVILDILTNKYKGKMPYTANSNSDEIFNEFSMSRKAFKRALGNLYKEEVVYFSEDKKYTIKK